MIMILRNGNECFQILPKQKTQDHDRDEVVRTWQVAGGNGAVFRKQKYPDVLVELEKSLGEGNMGIDDMDQLYGEIDEKVMNAKRTMFPMIDEKLVVVHDAKTAREHRRVVWRC